MKRYDFYTLSSVSSIMKQEENRGRLNNRSYSELVQGIYAELKKKRRELKDLELNPKIDSDSNVDDLNSEIKELERRCSQLKEHDLQNLVNEISTGKFKIELERIATNDKDVFITKNNESMVISRIISRELAFFYRVKPAERNIIIEQLIAILDNTMPKIVIRADVQNFYESIPQNQLIEKLKNDGFTSKRTLKYLKSFFYQYNCNKISEKDSIGLPRGLSFSAYLSEIFMMAIDKRISQISGVFFYKRYVDDIIIVANPQIKSIKDYWAELNDCFTNHSLELHVSPYDSKQYMSLLDEESEQEHFEYLGYKFCYDKGHLSVLLSEKRYKKYITTIDALFDIYSRCASSRKYKKTKNDKDKRPDALRQLMDRLRVLTGNGLLSGRKSFIATGVYFTNKYLTDLSQLRQLDDYLHKNIKNKEVFSPPKTLFNYGPGNRYDDNLIKIKEKLLEFSFVEGFTGRKLNKNPKFAQILHSLQSIYHKYSANE